MAAVEWVPAIAGGVVGLAGIVVSSLAARGERTLRRRLAELEQQDRDASELRASRRQIYSRYLSSVHSAMRDRANQLELMTAFNEVGLVAGPLVQRAITASYSAVLAALKADRQQGSLEAAAGAVARTTAALTMAMRQELGTPEDGDRDLAELTSAVLDLNMPGTS